MIFGKDRDKGLALDGLKLKVVTLGENGVTEKDILLPDAKEANPGIHMMLVNMQAPDYPVALGVIRAVSDKTYDDNVRDQVLEVQNKATIRNVTDLLHSGSTWTIGNEQQPHPSPPLRGGSKTPPPLEGAGGRP